MSFHRRTDGCQRLQSAKRTYRRVHVNNQPQCGHEGTQEGYKIVHRQKQALAGANHVIMLQLNVAEAVVTWMLMQAPAGGDNCLLLVNVAVVTYTNRPEIHFLHCMSCYSSPPT